MLQAARGMHVLNLLPGRKTPRYDDKTMCNTQWGALILTLSCPRGHILNGRALCTTCDVIDLNVTKYF